MTTSFAAGALVRYARVTDETVYGTADDRRAVWTLVGRLARVACEHAQDNVVEIVGIYPPGHEYHGQPGTTWGADVRDLELAEGCEEEWELQQCLDRLT